MRQRERGVVLVTVLIVAILVGAFCLVSLMISTSESQSTQASIQHTKALFVAQSGVEDEISVLKQMQGVASLASPFGAVDGLAGRTVLDGVVLSKDNSPVGEYSVELMKVEAAGPDVRNVTLQSTGWVPSSAAENASHRTVTVVVRMALMRSGVFDYAYFINNWGWYYGNTIFANGNVRSNGQFDGGNYAATVNPLPRFGTVEGTTLSNKLDEGGLYSGWNTVGADQMKGLAGKWTQQDADQGSCTEEDVGKAKYVHPFTDYIDMPNLTNLTVYEEIAKSNNSTIKVGNAQVCDAVVGDVTSGPGKENPNLYLYGTQTDPIKLNGLVVVRGNVVIQGYVTGKGSIYAQGNIYVAGDVMYVNPTPSFPTSKDTDTLKKWISDSSSADALGLFAREHIVVGNYTNGTWQSYVSQWVNDWRNASEEDAGADKIPNTYAGRDGIKGTADDNVLEGDHKWTVDRYTAAQQQAGLIPPGAAVGDPIPGTGEDIDGDGNYDPTTKMSDFNIPTTEFEINSEHWQGNVPQKKYSDIATNQITRLDAAFYTNHTMAMLTLAFGKPLTINGCVVSRNEAIIYGTTSLTINYDPRLMDGATAFGSTLPRTWQPIQMLVWSSDGTGAIGSGGVASSK